MFAMADDPATPDRAAIVELLVSIGRHAVELCETVYVDGPDYAGSAVVVRDRADAALPRIRAELALLRRSGRFRSIQHDEELQRTGRAILTRSA
ncbi:hypothetical protein [Streptomyces sp. NPDC002133]|uniref:hypothetical protein n=1 Tax=Streptomyces sp. NPDC002133 TaxID=3154409 RepID=UPI00331874C7